MKNDEVKVWLKKIVRPYKKSIFAITAASVAATVLSVVFAYLAKFLVNYAANGEKEKTLAFAVVLAVCVLLRIVFRTFVRYYAEKTRARMSVGLRDDAFSGILKAEYSKIGKYHSGEIITRATQDSAEIAAATVSITHAAVGMAVQTIGSLAALFLIDKFFTSILLIGGIIVIAITAASRKKLKKYQSEIMSADEKSRSFMQESVASAVTIKSYGAEEKTTRIAANISGDYAQKRIKRAKFNSAANALYSLVSNFGLLFAIIWCATGAFSGSADYGAVLSVVLLMEQLQRPFTSFSSIIPTYYSRLACAERLFEIYDLGLEESSEEVEKLDFDKICVRGASFSFGEKKVLSNVDFTVSKGETVLLSGESGAGKTTLMLLLLGIYKPDEGSVFIEKGGAYKSADKSTRSLFAYVPQGNFVLSGTIFDNVAFFSEKKGEELAETVKAALNIADADFVYALPNGLETRLGERGAGLSEGQIQRIALARAIASGRPILLLDEATSSLDSASEQRVLANVKQLKGITCIAVSHGILAEKYADRKVIL